MEIERERNQITEERERIDHQDEVKEEILTCDACKQAKTFGLDSARRSY